MININYRDGKPIFEQVKDGFRNLILSGVLTQGEKMPSVREIASSLAINPNTIQRAYRELEAEGYICSVPGKGSFVSTGEDAVEKRRAMLISDLRSLSMELKTAGCGREQQLAVIEEVYSHD